MNESRSAANRNLSCGEKATIRCLFLLGYCRVGDGAETDCRQMSRVYGECELKY